jgi:hypothetical protein
MRLFQTFLVISVLFTAIPRRADAGVGAKSVQALLSPNECEAIPAGRMSGSSELTLELTDIVINGTAYPLLTSTYEIKGKGEGGNTAKK